MRLSMGAGVASDAAKGSLQSTARPLEAAFPYRLPRPERQADRTVAGGCNMCTRAELGSAEFYVLHPSGSRRRRPLGALGSAAGEGPGRFRNHQGRRPGWLLVFPGVDAHGTGWLEVVDIARHDMQAVTVGRRCDKTVTGRNDSTSFPGCRCQFAPNMCRFSIDWKQAVGIVPLQSLHPAL